MKKGLIFVKYSYTSKIEKKQEELEKLQAAMQKLQERMQSTKDAITVLNSKRYKKWYSDFEKEINRHVAEIDLDSVPVADVVSYIIEETEKRHQKSAEAEAVPIDKKAPEQKNEHPAEVPAAAEEPEKKSEPEPYEPAKPERAAKPAKSEEASKPAEPAKSEEAPEPPADTTDEKSAEETPEPEPAWTAPESF